MVSCEVCVWRRIDRWWDRYVKGWMSDGYPVEDGAYLRCRAGGLSDGRLITYIRRLRGGSKNRADVV